MVFDDTQNSFSIYKQQIPSLMESIKSNLKFKFSDIIDIVKLLIVLLPLIREFLETINNWTEQDKSALKELIKNDE